MRNHTDEELAAAYQAGIAAAGNEIVDRYWDLASLIAQEYPIAGSVLDDRHMEAIQGLLKAAARWQPDKATKFKTFAKMVMKRRMIDLFRRRAQKNMVPPIKSLSLDAALETGDGEAGTMVDTIADDIDVFDEADKRIYAEAAASYILKAHKEVLFGLAQDYEQGEIAAYLGVGVEHVSAVVRFNRAAGAVFASRNDPDWIAAKVGVNKPRTPSAPKKAKAVDPFSQLLGRVRRPNPTSEIWNYTRNLIASHGATLTIAEVGAIVAHYFPHKRPLSDKVIEAHYTATGKVAR